MAESNLFIEHRIVGILLILAFLSFAIGTQRCIDSASPTT